MFNSSCFFKIVFISFWVNHPSFHLLFYQTQKYTMSMKCCCIRTNSILLKSVILLKHYIIILLFMNTWWIELNRHQNITLVEAQLPMSKMSMKQGHKLAEPHSAHESNRTDWRTWNWIKDLGVYGDHLQLGNLNKFPFFCFSVQLSMCCTSIWTHGNDTVIHFGIRISEFRHQGEIKALMLLWM